MDSCYYCGKNAPFVCDRILCLVKEEAIRDQFTCGRHICAEHAIPEYEHDDSDLRKCSFHLCKDHAKYQVKAEVTV